MKTDELRQFSERFIHIYEHLKLFSFIYFRGDCRGIDENVFMAETRFFGADTVSVLSFLEFHGLIVYRDGLLHLNRDLFYGLSTWDLLVLVEPWLGSRPPRGAAGLYSAMKRMAGKEKINMDYRFV